MRRILTLAALVASTLGMTAANGSAAVPTTSCRLMRSLIPPGSTDANHIRIRMSVRKVDGYLPRCDLATFVAGFASQHDGAYHATVKLMGARWYVGSYACQYRYHGDGHVDRTVVSTTCVHRGAYASTVWFDTYV